MARVDLVRGRSIVRDTTSRPWLRGSPTAPADVAAAQVPRDPPRWRAEPAGMSICSRPRQGKCRACL